MNTKKIVINKDKLVNSIFVALLLLFTIFLENTLQIYITNVSEYRYTFLDYLFFFSIMFIISLFVFSLIFYLLPNNLLYIFFVIALLVFIQSNFMVWSYGLLDGTTIKFGKYFYYGIIDSIIWILVIVITSLKREKIKNYIKQISITAISFEIIFIILSIFSTNVFKIKKNEWSKYYNLTNSISFSKDKNVIIWLLDMAQSDIFEVLLEEEPIFKEIYKDFIFYPDFSAATPFTKDSVPAILTSKIYKYKENNRTDFLVDSFTSDSSIIKKLGDNSYTSNILISVYGNDILYVDPAYIKNIEKRSSKFRRNLVSSLLEIFDLSVFRASPHFLKIIVYNNGNFFFQTYIKRIRDEINEKINMKNIVKKMDYNDKNNNSNESNNEKQNVNEYDKIKQILNNPLNDKTKDLALLKNIVNNARIVDEKCFNYIHLDSPHIPYNFNRNGDYTGRREDTIENYKDKYIYGLKLTYIFLDYLKINNIYDNSLIIILGDHGTSTGVNDKQSTIPEKNRSNPLLLIKPFNRGSDDIKINNNKISVFDIPSIIFEITNIENFVNEDNITDGERYFYSLKNERNNTTRIYEYKVKGNVREEASWQSTGKVYTRKGEFSFLETNPISKNIFKSSLIDKLEHNDKQFVLSIYNETKTGYILKENINDDEMGRLLHILTVNLNYFSEK